MTIEYPKPLFKNLEEAKNYYASSCFDKSKFKDKYPCLTCGGDGKEIAPDYVPEYQSRTEYITCRSCKGSGFGPKQAFMNKYRVQVVKQKNELAFYKADVKKCKEILDRLTKEEYSLLDKYFSPGWHHDHGIFDKNGKRWVRYKDGV